MAEYKIDIEKSAQNILDRIQQKFGISAEQLLELAQAYQEGRCRNCAWRRDGRDVCMLPGCMYFFG